MFDDDAPDTTPRKVNTCAQHGAYSLAVDRCPRCREADGLAAGAKAAAALGAPAVVTTKAPAQPAAKEGAMALKCKCGREFTHQGWFDKHQPVCGGAATKPAAKKAAPKTPPTRSERVGSKMAAEVADFDMARAVLQQSREWHAKKIAAIDAALAALA